MTYPCPACHSPASPETGCPGCGRGPDPDAAEVLRLNAELATLTVSVDEARRTYADLAAQLAATRRRREEVAGRVRAAAFLASPAPPSPAPVAPPSGEETSPRTAQNVLFVLGALLVGAAAIVFTGVALTSYGVVGRSVTLAVVTALVLVVPPLAAWRGLRSTAETFAALGMLLVVLDGYAAWYGDLFGFGTLDGAGYAALVCVVTAAVGEGYARQTGLVAPRLAALAAVQPLLPLVVVWIGATALGWSLAFAGTAALDLALVRAGARSTRVLAWIGFGCAQFALGACALVLLLFDAGTPLPLTGLPVLLGAVLLAAAGPLGRVSWLTLVGAATVPPAITVAVLRPVVELRGSALAVVGGALVLLLALAALRLPVFRTGALIAAGGLLLVLAAQAATVTFDTLAGSLPAFTAAGIGAEEMRDGWQLPAGLVGGTAALALLVPKRGRTATLAGGGLLVVLALPTWLELPWWAVSTIGLAVAAVLVLAVRPALELTLAAATLTAYAVVVGLARPWSAAAVFGALALLGGAAAVRSRLGAQWWCAAGLGAVPAAVATTVYAAGAFGPWPARAGLAAVSVPLVATLWFGRAPRLTWYAPAAGIALAVSAAVVGVWVPLSDVDEPAGVYPSVALLALAVAAAGRRAGAPRAGSSPDAAASASGSSAAPQPIVGPSQASGPQQAARPASGPSESAPPAVGPRAAVRLALGIAAVPVGVLALFAAAPALGALLFAPYTWWELAWDGVPDGVGLTPSGTVDIAAGPAATLLILAAVSLTVARPPRPSAPSPGGAATPPQTDSALPVSGTQGPAGSDATPASEAAGPVDPASAQRPVAGPPADADPAQPIGAVPHTTERPEPTSNDPGWAGPAVVLAGFLGVCGLLAVLAAAEAPWPAVPAVALAAGLGFGLAAALRPTPGTAAVPVLLLAGSGMSGLLPTAAGTLAGLGALIAAGAIAGAAGAVAAARVTGWMTAIAGGAGFGTAAVLAADLPLRRASFPVLAVGVVALALGYLLRRRRPGIEGPAVDALGHVAVVPALLLAWDDPRVAAAVATVWGAVLGVRAVLPGERARWQLALAACASELLAWWLLLAAWEVALREAYTLPGAALALAAGYLAMRRTEGLGSWLALGPGLAAALLPSLASVLVADGQLVRRLLLGAGAMAVVLVGAHRRWLAPVVAGGGTLVVLAVHELVVWDLLPRWAYLAGGGLVLILVAMTYERRLRDLRRVRGALGRMT